MQLKLQQVLDAKGLSQTELAHIIGVKRQYIHRLANNKRAGINLSTLERLCGGLGCSLAELVELDAPSTPSGRDA